MVAWDIIALCAAACLIVGLALFLPLYFKARARERLYEMLKVAYDKGQAVSPETVRDLAAALAPSREKDIRRGAVLIAAAIGLVVGGAALWLAIAEAGGEWARPIGLTVAAAGAIPFCIGAAHLILARMGKEPQGD